MNTTENNKIIAEFMGLKPKCERDGVYSFSDMPFFSIRENDIDKVVEGVAKYAKYNSDWNWLMEVVEKIENFRISDNEKSMRFDVKIKHHSCYINDWEIEGKNFIGSGGCHSKIEAVYNACLKFVKWHNEQKTK
jgi:hypothetical protein